MGLDLGWRLVDCGDKTLKMGTKEEGGKTMRERESERGANPHTWYVPEKERERKTKRKEKERDLQMCKTLD